MLRRPLRARLCVDSSTSWPTRRRTSNTLAKVAASEVGVSPGKAKGQEFRRDRDGWAKRARSAVGAAMDAPPNAMVRKHLADLNRGGIEA